MKPYRTYFYFLTLFIVFGIGSSIVVAGDAQVKDELKTEKTPEVLVIESKTLLEDINNLSKKQLR